MYESFVTVCHVNKIFENPVRLRLWDCEIVSLLYYIRFI